jgi:hypothetical protein
MSKETALIAVMIFFVLACLVTHPHAVVYNDEIICSSIDWLEADIGHILFLRILYHIPYHGQKSDIIPYPISRLKKG